MKKRVLAYLAGVPAGLVVGFLVNLAIEKPLSGVWIGCWGNFSGILAMAWAQYRGWVPSPEEASRPISLFPRGRDKGGGKLR